jgi:hypothetical protein
MIYINKTQEGCPRKDWTQDEAEGDWVLSEAGSSQEKCEKGPGGDYAADSVRQ